MAPAVHGSSRHPHRHRRPDRRPGMSRRRPWVSGFQGCWHAQQHSTNFHPHFGHILVVDESSQHEHILYLLDVHKHAPTSPDIKIVPDSLSHRGFHARSHRLSCAQHTRALGVICSPPAHEQPLGCWWWCLPSRGGISVGPTLWSVPPTCALCEEAPALGRTDPHSPFRCMEASRWAWSFGCGLQGWRRRRGGRRPRLPRACQCRPRRQSVWSTACPSTSCAISAA
jgi:hypothetical protein